jgi:hypothetical protein
MPRGIWLVSGTFGCPEPAENRTVTGIGVVFFCRVSGFAHRGRRSSRGERALQDDALRVIRTHSRMDTEHAVEGVDELFRQRFLTGRRFLRHDKRGESQGSGECGGGGECFPHRLVLLEVCGIDDV